MRILHSVTPMLLGTAHAFLDLVSPTENCQPRTAMGKSSCCVYPNCRSGDINSFANMCLDAGLKTYCPANQVYKTVGAQSSEKLNSGEMCDSSGLFQWTSYRYNWQCCDCPPGYVSHKRPPNCGLFDWTCVGCTEEVERPIWSKKEQGWKCSTNCHETPGKCETSPPAPRGKCSLDSMGADFLKTEEGWCSSFYYAGDPRRKLKTIGHGHDCAANGDCDALITPITPCQGDELFAKDVATAVKYLRGSRRENFPNLSGMNQNQFSALVSFAYQCQKKAEGFRRRLQNKDYDGICQDLIDGKYCASIEENKKRRYREGILCMTPTNVKSGC